MTRALVVGIGNPWRGDDGAGRAVVERLAARGLPQGCATMSVRLPTPELAEPLARAALVIFVDAAVDLRPGVVEVSEVAPDPIARPASHAYEPGPLLALAGFAYGRVPRARLVRIGAAQFDCPGDLSALVRGAVDEATELVRRLVEDDGRLPGAAARVPGSTGDEGVAGAPVDDETSFVRQSVSAAASRS